MADASVNVSTILLSCACPRSEIGCRATLRTWVINAGSNPVGGAAVNGGSSNGRTTDSGSVNWGSSPCPSVDSCQRGANG